MSCLLGLIGGPAASAMGTLTISSPANGSATNTLTPVISGTTDPPNEETEAFRPVTVTIYPGPVPGPESLPPLETSPFLGAAWSVTTQPLSPGIYTATAEQPKVGGGKLHSEPVTFTVDTTSPQIGLHVPSPGSSATGASQLVAGSAGTAEGDLPTITVQLFSGTTTDPGAFREGLVVQASNGSWSGTLGGLSPGTYTVRAEQSDWAGNVARTTPVSFTLTAPTPAPDKPPVAAFTWFPLAPTTGEAVTLVASSTDTASPITGFAWAPAADGVFHPGGPAFVTSFAAPGDHLVRLSVTAADGLSSVAIQTIHVTRAPLILMQPFPIVRIAGIETAHGVKLSLLTAQAPRGASVTVRCQGRGCPVRSERRLSTSSRRHRRGGTAEVEFRRFERSLRAGVVLEIRVSKPGTIGKYTRFSIRRGKLPVRIDSCIESTDPKPVGCPS